MPCGGLGIDCYPHREAASDRYLSRKSPMRMDGVNGDMCRSSRKTHHSSMAIQQHVSMQQPLSLSVCFGRCVHVLGRTPDQVSVQVERQSGSGNFPSFQHYTVTSLAPSCDLGQFTLLPYPYRSDILPSLRLRVACFTLPMLHSRTRLLPCDDDERRRGAVRAQTRPRPPFARIGIHP